MVDDFVDRFPLILGVFLAGFVHEDGVELLWQMVLETAGDN